jgi:phosphatidylserine/phosphatidylglycerophosphate/cardiolipin synthase-like enzyme
MAKKRTRKPPSKGSIIGIIIIGVILLIGSATGLITVDWTAVLSGEDLSQAVSGPSDSGQSRNTLSEPVRVEPISGEWYRLYFTTPQFPDEQETRTQTIVDGLIEVINSAQRSLDIAIYELDLEEVGEAILAAHDRGVEVRLVTDTDELEELETLIWLEEEGIPIVPDERSPLMHNKFLVVDSRAVWTGSWNFTPNGTYRNNNHGIYIQSPELAQNYAIEFEEMFGDRAFGPKSPANTPNPRISIGDTLIETCFAPEDECAAQLTRLVNQAQQSIRFIAFSFTHDDIGQAVSDRAREGVTIQGIFETRGSNTEHSEFGRMEKEQLDVWQDGNPYTLHHKVFIIDDETVVLGSFNFSNNADTANDENILIIRDADIARQFQAEFERMYAVVQNPPNK